VEYYNGYRYCLTIWFDDGDVVKEFFWHQRWMNSAKKEWFRMAEESTDGFLGKFKVERTLMEALWIS
jgi:hypothetical protein